MSNPAPKPQPQPSYFQQQRELLTSDIRANMEQVLQNINQLNRSLEGVIAVGNEFSSVEALWSHFEGVMAPSLPPESESQRSKEGGASPSVG